MICHTFWLFLACDVTRHMTEVVINDGYLVRGTFALFSEPLFFIHAIRLCLGLLMGHPGVCSRHPDDQLSPLFRG